MAEYKDLLDDMLRLSGLPLNEQSDDEDSDIDTEVDIEDTESKGGQKSPESEKDEKDEKDEKAEKDEELTDSWDVSIDSTGKISVEFHETDITVKFKEKEEKIIKVPNSLKNDIDKVSKLFNEILSYVERVS